MIDTRVDGCNTNDEVKSDTDQSRMNKKSIDCNLFTFAFPSNSHCARIYTTERFVFDPHTGQHINNSTTNNSSSSSNSLQSMDEIEPRQFFYKKSAKEEAIHNSFITVEQIFELLRVPNQLVFQLIRSPQEGCTILRCGLVGKEMKHLWKVLKQKVQVVHSYGYHRANLNVWKEYFEFVQRGSAGSCGDSFCEYGALHYFNNVLHSVYSTESQQIQGILRMCQRYGGLLEKLSKIQNELKHYKQYNEANSREMREQGVGNIAQRLFVSSTIEDVLFKRIQYILDSNLLLSMLLKKETNESDTNTEREYISNTIDFRKWEDIVKECEPIHTLPNKTKETSQSSTTKKKAPIHTSSVDIPAEDEKDKFFIQDSNENLKKHQQKEQEEFYVQKTQSFTSHTNNQQNYLGQHSETTNKNNSPDKSSNDNDIDVDVDIDSGSSDMNENPDEMDVEFSPAKYIDS